MSQATDKKQWIADVVAAYEGGASDPEILKIMRVTQSTFDNYYDTVPAFKEVVDLGRAMAKAWWLEQGRLNIHNTKFNTTLWAFHMKNLYGWADKTETVNTNENYDNMDLNQIESMLRKKLPGMYKMLKPEMTDAEVVSLDAHRSK